VHAHNDIFNIAAIAGIPGAIFFVGIWLTLFVYLVRMRRKYLRAQIHNPAAWERLRFCTASLLGSAVFFVSALTEATFADEEVRQLLMFVWAAGLWTTYKQSSNQSAAPSELSWQVGGKRFNNLSKEEFMATNTVKNSREELKWPFGRNNYVVFALALVVIIIGYVLLGKGSITAAPVVLVLGYCVLIPIALIIRSGTAEKSPDDVPSQ
jgi:hypothetical protein